MLKGQYIHTSKHQGTITALKKYFRKYCTSNNSFEKNISLWEGVVALKGQYTYEQATITENISLWEGVVALKDQYI